MRGSERKLLRETYYDTTLDFFYDHTGSPYAMSYQVGSSDPIIYYYILNLQGDVVMMVDADGDEVARYTYDPYGKILTATGIMADINPLRYRGYYYDAETGMYYLQSRYYDPVVGRFINADSYASTGQGFIGYNMFAYCLNNPADNLDPSGAGAIAAFDSKYSFYAVNELECGGGGIPVSPVLCEGIENTVTAVVSYAVSYAYRQYTRYIKKSAENMMPGNYPITHHIIPYGNFSMRSEDVRKQLMHAQEIMIRAGVYPEYDPYNQMTLSTAYHVSLHTDSYILSVTTPIIALGENATKEQIYSVLFDLRIILAGTDPFALYY